MTPTDTYPPDLAPKHRRRVTIEQKVYIALAIALAAIFALGFVSYLSVRDYLQVSASIDRVQLLRDAIEEYFDAMQDAETGQRGYLLTGKEAYLEPYDNAIRNVQRSLVALATRAQEVAIRGEDVDALRKLTFEKLNELRHSIARRRNNAFDAARDISREDAGKSTMDQIRREIASMQGLARGEIMRMEAASQAGRERSVFFVLTFIVVVSVMLIAAARVIIVDLKERERLNRQLRELASRDALTNLPNRRFFLEMASYALAQARRNKVRSAIMFLDLDGFKKINDELGHERGDKLLIEVAERFSVTARKNDLVARLGGDEFAILIHEVPVMEELAILATRLIDSLSPTNMSASQERFVGVSIGIAVYPEDAENAAALLDSADQAMYLAKHGGKNRFRFLGGSAADTPDREARLREDMAKALANDELGLLYQPIVEVNGGRIVGVEALLRWQHPTLGPVIPDEFIPIAERSGLIVPIGAWVLSTACRQVRQWLDEGLGELHVAVNVAAEQWRHGELARLVEAALSINHLPPRALELEITERSWMRSDTNAEFAGLKAIGVRLSIDDFGTGYSSLSYLKRFSIDTIKIDRAFVSGLPNDPTDIVLVRAIIAMAKSLGIALVGEGIETKAQLAFLSEHGCEYAQGYFIKRPMSPGELAELVRLQRQSLATLL